MEKLAQIQKDIYEVKQLLTIQRLRAYKHDCLTADLAKSIGTLGYEIIKGDTQYV